MDSRREEGSPVERGVESTKGKTKGTDIGRLFGNRRSEEFGVRWLTAGCFDRMVLLSGPQQQRGCRHARSNSKGERATACQAAARLTTFKPAIATGGQGDHFLALRPLKGGRVGNRRWSTSGDSRSPLVLLPRRPRAEKADARRTIGDKKTPGSTASSTTRWSLDFLRRAFRSTFPTTALSATSTNEARPADQIAPAMNRITERNRAL